MPLGYNNPNDVSVLHTILSSRNCPDFSKG